MENNNVSKESLVTMSKDSWHYRLVLWAWGIYGEDYKNLCPYFWLVVAAVLAFPFVCLARVLTNIHEHIRDRSERISNEKKESLIEEFQKSVTKEQLEDLGKAYYFFDDSDLKWQKLIPKGLDRRDLVSLYPTTKHYEWDYHTIKEDFYRKGYLSKSFIKENKMDKATRVKRANNIIKIGKLLAGLALTAVIGALTLSAAVLLLAILCSIAQCFIVSPVGSFIGLGIVIGIALIIFLIAYFKEDIRWARINFLAKDYAHVPAASWVSVIPFVVLFECVIWNGIFVNAWMSITSIFKMFGGLFGEYFGAAYTDYCPGIKWKEEEE